MSVAFKSAAAAVLFRQPTVAPSRAGKGAEIRARIAANRAKRLGIAAAMKREAGVTEHTVHQWDDSGLAYLDTGRIVSPEGRKIVQLYTLAHECGHIFLHGHGDGDGYWLAGHIKEFEAECYAHQAFREHGMTLPRRLSKSGRDYVASWIAKDRAAGIAIDPRVKAYAAGRWSPYEPLRLVPPTWRIFRAAGAPVAAAARPGWWRSLFDGLRGAARPGPGRPAQGAPQGLAAEAATVLRLAGVWALNGTVFCHLALQIALAFHPMPDVFPRQPGQASWAGLVTAATGGLLLANLAVLWRTMTRRPRACAAGPGGSGMSGLANGEASA
jgi:hypothetical protein